MKGNDKNKNKLFRGINGNSKVNLRKDERR